ncbi:ABC transporter substrate-binding protein [Pseudonocardia sp. H11422]|uniref:ABC transporter substrate-binding protein n=1 Tax=Pseudonocardia sp. H11422 TaxID=2835866 RepID=UPI001BDCC3FD|nr:ABC transporter substrate-binding protein [Pseudonocardia sp. H11422]
MRTRSARGRSAAVGGLLAAATLLLTACGGAGATDAGPEAAAETRTVATAFGDIAVPAAPQRVVALGEPALDTALALGVVPVGTTASRGGTAPPAYLGEQAASVPVVGTVNEPNVEEVLAAEPDLVLAGTNTTREQYDALSKIAPTVAPAAAAMNAWREPLRTYAAALGQSEELDRQLTEIERRAAAVQQDGTFAVLRWMPAGPVVMNAGLMPGTLLSAGGAAPVQPAATLGGAPHSDPLSLENLTQVDADRIFIASLNAEGRDALEAAQQQPAFTRLKAAQAGAVTSVDGGVWSSSSGPIAARTVVEDIERAAAAG